MEKMMRHSLDGNWKMLVLHDDQFREKTMPVSLSTMDGAGAIDAVVPGNFEIDLERAGLVPDPFFGTNTIKMQEYEDAHILYARTFTYDPVEHTEPVLVFEGLDTIADIYLNGYLVGSADNMYISHRFALPGIVTGENEVMVHFSPVCLASRDRDSSAGLVALDYNFETLRLRKAPHMFAWDIMPRLVSAGIYRTVNLCHLPEERFDQAYLMTKRLDLKKNKAELELFFQIDIGNRPIRDYSIKVSGSCGDSTFSVVRDIWFTAGKLCVQMENPRLWWPKGYGNANLYDVTVSLEKEGKQVDSRTFRFGIRTVRLERTSTTDMLFSGDFHFEINEKRVFVQGTNWVPVDAYHSRDRERIPRIMELLDDIGCNALRCWGGNIYEDPIFYEACDEMGIMVWQDFAMACGIYPIDPDFCEVMRAETTQVVRALRQHPSIVLWAGDNECDYFMKTDDGYGRDPNQNRVTRQVLPDVLYMEDPTRPYLPSSPYIDEIAWKVPYEFLTESHLWGPRDYYKSAFYRNSLCNFASEMGYHGCPSVKSIRKFISEEKLWPWQDNEEWKAHAASPDVSDSGRYTYRIELMAKQIKEMFGEIPEKLEDFALASQISQAEAKKFFVELFRTDQPKRSGVIWWNLIDGWPQFSDAVVDYYYEKKLAYHYIKQSQMPLLLTFTEPHDWLLRLVAVNNAGKSLSFSYTVTDYDTRETVLSGESSCDDQTAFELGALPYSQGEKKLYVLEWTCGEYSGRNHYLAGNPPFLFEDYRVFLTDTYGGWL